MPSHKNKEVFILEIVTVTGSWNYFLPQKHMIYDKILEICKCFYKSLLRLSAA